MNSLIDELPQIEHEKLKNIMLAHLDGVYVFSARENCDELVTAVIKLCAEKNLQLKAAKADLAALKEETKGWIPV